MTPEQIESNVAAYRKALADGKFKGIQYYGKPHLKEEGWHDCDQDRGFDIEICYRIKPEPKLRPWKPEEVPVGCLFRYKDWYRDVRAMILTVNGDGITWADCSDATALIRVRFCELMERCVHSLDGGKTWKECGIYED